MAFFCLMLSNWIKKIDPNQVTFPRYYSLLYEEESLTNKIKIRIRNSVISGTFKVWIEFLVALLSVVLYSMSTYAIKVPGYILLLEKVSGLFFLVDFFLNAYSAPTWAGYILSIKGLIDLSSIIPLGFYWSGEKSSTMFEIFLFLRVLRVYPLLKTFGLTGLSIEQQIFTLVVHTLGLIFIAAGIMQWVDNKATTAEYKTTHSCNPKGCMTFGESIYFTIVTLSTVGYGDVTPHSSLGQLVAMLAILAAVMIFPLRVKTIVELASQRPYGVYTRLSRVVGPRFIVVSGNFTVEILQEFFGGFFHPTYGKDTTPFPLHVVVMSPTRPSFELTTLLAHYNGRVTFVEGSLLKEIDLCRVEAKMASAFFLIADPNAQDLHVADSSQILRALSIQRHTNSKVRVIVELLKPENKMNSIWVGAQKGIEIVCPQDIRFKLLFKSVTGLTTFITNLFCKGPVFQNVEEGMWSRQYQNGLSQKVYPVLLPNCFHQNRLLFEEVVDTVYKLYEVIIFGLDVVKSSDTDREVIIFPTRRVILPTDVGICIAQSLEVAQKVTKMGIDSIRTLVRARPRSPDMEMGGEAIGSQVEEGEVEGLRENPFERMELQMRWPRSNIEYRPNEPIFQSKAENILSHLRNHTLANAESCDGHFLVCLEGKWPSNFYYFFVLSEVLETRVERSRSKDIVILHPNRPTATEWGCTIMHNNIYFVHGSPLYEIDLIRGGALKAGKIIILESENTVEYPQTIFIAAALKKLLKDKPDKILVEVHQEGMSYLQAQPDQWPFSSPFSSLLDQQCSAGMFHYHPSYINGSAFSHKTLIFLMYSSFFNQNTVPILEHLISGFYGTSKKNQIWALHQRELQKEYIGTTFGQMFTALLLQEVPKLALGLYRQMGTHGSPISYVLTNPRFHDRLESEDLVFLLG